MIMPRTVIIILISLEISKNYIIEKKWTNDKQGKTNSKKVKKKIKNQQMQIYVKKIQWKNTINAKSEKDSRK